MTLHDIKRRFFYSMQLWIAYDPWNTGKREVGHFKENTCDHGGADIEMYNVKQWLKEIKQYNLFFMPKSS